MEYQKIILLITGLLVVVAIYLAITSAPPVQAAPANSTEAQNLLFKGAGFGKGLGDYTYSYSDISDGYKVDYTIVKSGGNEYAEIRNPLSLIKMYMFSNDTILCINYPVNESCSSVYGNANMSNYVAFVQSKFYNDTTIDQATSSLQYLLGRGYLIVNPDVSDSTAGLKSCKKINYIIDYRNLSLDEAAKFSISSSSPRLFFLSDCIDNSSGLPYETTLDYVDNQGGNHSAVLTVTAFSTQANQIVPPTLSGDAVGALTAEKQQQITLAQCFTAKTGADREKCISDTALVLLRKDLCEYDGSRRDRCLVALVPLTKDQTICDSINDPSYKDDCFVELAGAYKNNSYCSSVANTSKVQECQDAAVPKNTTNMTYNASSFLNYIDQLGQNSTGNSSTQMNGTANATNMTQNGTSG